MFIFIECPPLSQEPGRCGPHWGGRCNKDLKDSAIYCKANTGWCEEHTMLTFGAIEATEEHKDDEFAVLRDDTYDWKPETCRGNRPMYIIHYSSLHR